MNGPQENFAGLATQIQSLRLSSAEYVRVHEPALYASLMAAFLDHAAVGSFLTGYNTTFKTTPIEYLTTANDQQKKQFFAYAETLQYGNLG